MANYTQYQNGSMSQTSVAQRLLNNSSDWVAVRIGQYQYIFIQGHINRVSSSSLSYSGQKWLYDTSSTYPTLTYTESDEGTITVVNSSYIYSSLPQYQSLDVIDYFPKLAFFAVVAFILVFVGFNIFKKRWIV